MSDSQDSPDFSEASEHGSQKRDRRQTVAWDKAAASKLVMEVEKREQLWNHLHSNYRNFKASRLIWNEIALVIGRSSEDCTNKWASLRSNYRSRCVPSGRKIPEPYCHMGFLVGVLNMQPKLRIANANEVPDAQVFISKVSDADDNDDADDDDDDNSNGQSQFNNTAEIVDSFADPLASSPSPSMKRRRNFAQPPTSSTLKDVVQGTAMERPIAKDDEWDIGAKHMAEQMRNAADEFPILADEFRTEMLQFMLKVQKRRSEMRASIVVDIDGSLFRRILLKSR